MAAPSRAAAGSSSSWSKWQIALAVGAPVVLGFGYWYLRSNEPSTGIDRRKSSDGMKETTPSLGTASQGSSMDAGESGDAVIGAENPADVGKDLAKAESQLNIAPSLDRAQHLKNKGNKYFKSGKYNEAVDCYNEAIQACPYENVQDLSTFYQNRAAAYEHLKNYENVKKDCSKALELNPKYVKALLRRAKACEYTKDLQQSLEDITAACILECFQNQSSLLLADKVLKELGRLHAKEAMAKRQPIMPSKHFIKTYFSSFIEDPITKSLAKERESDMDESGRSGNSNSPAGGNKILICQRLGIDDDYMKPYLPPEAFECKTATDSRTTKQTKENESKEQPSVADEAGSSSEDNSRGYLYAKEALRNQNYDDIIPSCTEEIEMEDGKYKREAYLLRATFYLLLGEHSKAMGDFKAVIQDDTADVKLRVNGLIKRASLYMQREEPGKSIEDFNWAARLDSSNSDVYHHRGQVHLLMEKVQEAMEDFNKAVSLNPNFPIAYVQKCYTDYRYAFSVRDMERMQKVMQSFQDAVQRFPKCAECYSLFAQVLSDQQEFEKADKYFQKALEIDPENSTTYVHRGLLTLQWTGEVDRATELITKAVEMDDKCEFGYETLGTIEVQRGNLKRAIELFDKAIPLAKTELEMSHLFSLKDAAVAQAKVAEKMGIPMLNVGIK